MTRPTGTDSIRPFYADWPGYNRRVAEHLGRLSPEDLALIVPAARDGGVGPWPIWAVAGHTVGARIYWLCHVFGEPGAETTPFTDPSGFGWEDDLTVVRSGAEVVGAYESTSLSARGIPSSQWPQIRMLNTAANQDGCKGATLTLSFTGSSTVTP